MTGGVRPLWSTAAATPACRARRVSVSVGEVPRPVRTMLPTVHPRAAKNAAAPLHLPWTTDESDPDVDVDPKVRYGTGREGQTARGNTR